MHTGTVIMTVYIRGFVSNQSQYCTFDLNWQPLNNWGSLFLSFYKGHYQTKIAYGTPHWVKGAINYAGVDPHGQGPRNKLPQLRLLNLKQHIDYFSRAQNRTGQTVSKFGGRFEKS